MKIVNEKIYIESEVFQQGRQLNEFEKFLQFICTKFNLFFPFLAQILDRKLYNQFYQINIIFYFLIGILYSVIIFVFSIHQLENIDRKFSLVVFLLMMILISTTMAFNMQVRCVMSLTVFNFVFKTAKIMLTSYVLVGILNGPIQNSIHNIEEMSESFKCQFEFNRNMSQISKSKAQMNQNLVREIQSAASEMADQEIQVKNVSELFRYELNTDHASEFNSMNKKEKRNTFISNDDNGYTEKTRIKCENTHKKANENCINFMQIFAKNCQGLLCYFSDDYRFLSGWDLTKRCKQEVNSCESIDKSNFSGIKSNVDHLDIISAYFSSNLSVEVRPIELKMRKHKILNIETVLKFQIDIEEFRGNFKSFQKFMQFFIKLINLFTNYIFTLVIISCFNYHSKYVRDVSFDNHVITQYFRHIDAKRFQQQKRTLLPLKKCEQANLNYPFQFFVSAFQKKSVKVNVYLNLLFAAVLLLTLLIDKFVVDFVQIFTANSGIGFEYKSKHNSRIVVEGKGLMAGIAKQLTKGMGRSDETDFKANNQHCVPKVTTVSSEQILSLLKQIGMLMLVIFSEIYTKRFNRNICALFYRKLEKKRIIWLYNEMLKKRNWFIANAKKKIMFKKQNGLIEKESCLEKFLRKKNYRVKHVIILLMFFGLISKRRCVLCNQWSSKTGLECSTCSIVCCVECWYDLKEKCVLCSEDFSEDHSWEYEFEFEK